MRLKFLQDLENANFIKRMAASGEQPLVETDIEQIMSARPNMSNRDVAAFLRILKKKLPAKIFSLNIKKALEKKIKLVESLFFNGGGSHGGQRWRRCNHANYSGLRSKQPDQDGLCQKRCR